MSVRIPIKRDIIERVAVTFLEGAVGVAIADFSGLLDLTGTEFWAACVTGGIMAVLAFGKSALATRVGRRSASLDPAVGLAPTTRIQPDGPLH